MAFQNTAAIRRRRLAKRYHGYMRQLGMLEDLRKVSRQTGVDMDTLKNLEHSTPKLETLEKIGGYIEDVFRAKREG